MEPSLKRSSKTPFISARRRALDLASASAIGWVVACASPPPQTPADTDPAAPAAPGASGNASGQPAADLSAGLDSAATRADTVKRLIAEFDEAAVNGTRTEAALAFTNRYVEPLTKTYVEHGDSLGNALRGRLLNLLVSFDDPRSAPAHAKAIRNYENRRDAAGEAIWACQFAQKHRSAELASALLEALGKVDITSDDGQRFSRHLLAAMRVNANASWTSVLREKLRPGLKPPEQFNDSESVKKFNNQRFQQSAATQLLGYTGSADAVVPLFETLMDNDKHELHAAAERSLLHLGLHSIQIAHSLLLGNERRLEELAHQARTDIAEPEVYFATRVIDSVAHPSSLEPIAKALKRTRDPVSRALLAKSLSRLPKSDARSEIRRLFQEAYAGLSATTTMPGGGSALEYLAQAAPDLFDPELTPWLAQRTASVPGKGARQRDVQQALVIALAQLATPSQIQKVRVAAKRHAGKTATPAWDAAVTLTERCKEDAACYLQLVIDPANQSPAALPSVLKALTMVGIYGGDQERDTLLQHLDSVAQPDAKTKLAQVIDHLTPSSEKTVLGALRQHLRAQDKARSAGELALQRLVQRLSAR
jgi:hypothetical protein